MIWGTVRVNADHVAVAPGGSPSLSRVRRPIEHGGHREWSLYATVLDAPPWRTRSTAAVSTPIINAFPTERPTPPVAREIVALGVMRHRARGRDVYRLSSTPLRHRDHPPPTGLCVNDIEAEARRLDRLVGQGNDLGWITIVDPEGLTRTHDSIALLVDAFAPYLVVMALPDSCSEKLAISAMG